VRSGRADLIVRAVGRSGHGRPLYADGLTFHPRHTDRLTAPGVPAIRGGAEAFAAGSLGPPGQDAGSEVGSWPVDYVVLGDPGLDFVVVVDLGV